MPNVTDILKRKQEFMEDGVITPEEQAELEQLAAAVMGQTTEEDAPELSTDIKEQISGGVESFNMAQQTQRSDVQLNPLPSLPSISNVGSTPFTGVVNWNAIPGGFQPLPQVAGGRKKLYQLSQFHGGINQKSSPRDISDQECQEAKNITVSNIGRIKLLGDCKQTDNSIAVSGATDDRGRSGYGLFQFTAPADAAGNAGQEIITLTADTISLDANDLSDGTNTVDWITVAGGSDNTDVAHIIYAAGNGVYVADATHARTSRAPKAKIYVYREDQKETVSGWVQGSPALESPTYDNEAATPVTYVGIQNTDMADSATLAGALDVCIVPDATGTWDEKYFFYVSWLFDGGCETGLTAIGIEEFSDNALRFNPSLNHTNAAPLGGNKRIEGARVYFKAAGTSERYLLAELSLIDGVKGALDSSFIPWTLDGNIHDLADPSRKIFVNPPEVYTYASLNGYYANEVYSSSRDHDQEDATGGVATAGPTAHAVRYTTVVVGQQGIVFIGNVTFKGKHMPDSMMFSMPGKPGLFPKFNTFDSPSSDGSPIIALAAFQDTILQFKQNAMYVINVSNPAQFYAEAAFRDCGVSNPCQVFTTSFGVIFANKHGCFIYDGKKVISLTSGKFDVADWGLDENICAQALSTALAQAAEIPCVGYDPRSQSIIVLKNIGDDATSSGGADGLEAWVYNMLTQSWTESIDMITNANNQRHSNFIISSKGFLSILSNESGDNNILNYNHDKAVDTGDQTITYITKDMDFGLPSQTKKIFKVYVTYFSDDSTVPTMTFGVDGDTTPTEAFDSGVFASSGGLQTTAFTVSDGALTGIKSLSLKIAGATDHSFEIQDISILYRPRPIK